MRFQPPGPLKGAEVASLNILAAVIGNLIVRDPVPSVAHDQATGPEPVEKLVEFAVRSN